MSTERQLSAATAETTTHDDRASKFVRGFHGVRYQIRDVSRSVAFYTLHLGFKLEHQQLPAFASVSFDNVQVLLSGPGASGSRPMPLTVSSGSSFESLRARLLAIVVSAGQNARARQAASLADRGRTPGGTRVRSQVADGSSLRRVRWR
jgi:catechol 2,3-dioxygenase-like lactoylglutathione lyase family enzyme